MASCFRIVVAALLAALLYPIATIVHAAYPDRPIRVIVVFPPGGSNDVTARIVFNKMPEIVGERFIIENRGGAAGSLGAAVVAQSPADGYTIMVQSTTHIANAFMYKGKLPYDTLGDFIGLTPMAKQVGMLVVHPSLPVKSIQDLIALAKKRPGDINAATAGLGSFVHLNLAQFMTRSNTKMTLVAYRGGGPSAIAMMSGECQVTISTIGSAYRYIRAKRMRPLGVTSKERNPKFPNVPAIGEVVPGFEFTAWVGAFVPAGTPKAVVNKLNLDLKKALADPQVVKALTNVTLDPMYMTPEQFAARLKSDYARYETLMKQIGVIK
jgi:tripartite-type tricarboxylate transporter receptor subunit TctC